MATLEELWKQNGEKPGLKVRNENWDEEYHFVVMGKAPSGGFYGYGPEGYSSFWIDTGDWYQWTGLKTKYVTMWPALIKTDVGYRMSKNLYTTDYDARDGCGSDFIRLLTEMPIQVEVE